MCSPPSSALQNSQGLGKAGSIQNRRHPPGVPSSGRDTPPQKRTAPLCSPGGKVLSGKPYESAHRRRPPWPQLFAACPSQAPVPVISPMSLRAHRPSELPSAPRNDWKGPTRGRFALHSWILWVSGTEECGPQRLGWVRLGWELGEGAHKAERAGAKTGM